MDKKKIIRRRSATVKLIEFQEIELHYFGGRSHVCGVSCLEVAHNRSLGTSGNIGNVHSALNHWKLLPEYTR